MSTVPPTPAEIDAYIPAQYGESLPYPLMGFICAYTQHDGTKIYGVLNADPTVDASSQLIIAGILANYGACTVREYVGTLPTSTPIADQAADDAEQARINNPANWIAAP
jgi:hypothetical protein